MHMHMHTRAAIALSVDHKPNSKEERARIESLGGVVVWAGTWRVGGVLAVSRAFGDRPLKRFVIPTPDTKEELLGHDDEFIVLASDGLWDVMSNQVRPGLRRKSGLLLSMKQGVHSCDLGTHAHTAFSCAAF